MYRLHLDIPLEGLTREASSLVSELLIDEFKNAVNEVSENLDNSPLNVLRKMNYRLGHDDDRNHKNHLEINENGHVGSGKQSVTF